MTSTLNGSTHDAASSTYDGTSSTHDETSSTHDETSSSRKAKKVQFQTDLMVEGGNEKGSDILDGRHIVPDHAFNIFFLGGPGVGKSQIINRVSRASPFPNIR
jgi:predicted ATP-dependent serine protease